MINSIMVTYWDIKGKHKVRVKDKASIKKYGYRSTQFSMFGATREQAIRQAKYIMVVTSNMVMGTSKNKNPKGILGGYK